MRTGPLLCLAWLSAVVVTASVAACSGDEVDESNTCSGAAYDPCLTEHDCMSVDCRVINAELTCTQACSASTPCPDLDGQPVPCGVGGICEPPHPRDCEPK